MKNRYDPVVKVPVMRGFTSDCGTISVFRDCLDLSTFVMAFKPGRDAQELNEHELLSLANGILQWARRQELRRMDEAAKAAEAREVEGANAQAGGAVPEGPNLRSGLEADPVDNAQGAP